MFGVYISATLSFCWDNFAFGAMLNKNGGFAIYTASILCFCSFTLIIDKYWAKLGPETGNLGLH